MTRPRHPCRPPLRRRDRLSAAIIAACVAALAAPHVAPLLPRQAPPEPISSCAPLMVQPSMRVEILEL